MTNAMAVRASHLTCCRSNWSPARYRITSETGAAARNAASATKSPPNVPISREPSTGPGFSAPSGFEMNSEAPPGAGSATGPGCTARPAAARPASTKPATATGRQRRDGSVPVGNSRNMNAMVNTVGAKLPCASAPTCVAAGSDPGNVLTPVTA